MLKLKYLASPGAKTKCNALTLSLKFLVYFLKKKSQPKVHPGVTTSCYRTIIQPRQNIQTKFPIGVFPIVRGGGGGVERCDGAG